MKKKLLIITIIFLSQIDNYAQELPRVDIPGSQVQKITSQIVAGQEYELDILLPGGYKTSNKKYPVIYLMDSQWDFPLVKSIYGQQYYDGFVPELIIVGVTWGGVNPNPDSLRARDYTPTIEARLPQSGGADKFLSFMKDELFPFIETNYKADNNNRTLMGCSLGGLITLYALFTHTDMFTGYVAASPAIGWSNELILFRNAKTPTITINKQIWDVGALGYDRDRTRIVELKPVLKYLYVAKTVDTSELDKSEWNLVNEEGDIHFP